ncbi:kinase-like domain-containing protein [Gigaspora rosea]|uniref:Kinase-like domain-containing protein n=1 Tax=Gigaspora rosea TaxID=44941 RepID=A0A397VF70_9GLOM|nr:kinase-like domain-containing protein [Gigaspora rosea]
MSDVGIEGKSNRTQRKAIQFCPDCDRPRKSYGWCPKCESRCMEKNFPFWTSGNNELDKIIQFSQISAVQTCDYLEFIKFEDIEFNNLIAKGGFSKVYKGVWIDGPRWNWDEIGDIWCRSGPIEVALKELNNSQILSHEFLEQLKRYYQCLQNGTMADCFGITRNNETGCYMFVMRYYENGNLYEFLDRNKGIISWRDMVDMLWGIASGLEKIHSENLFHSNLHGGNLLIEDETISTDAKIADIGLHGKANEPIDSEYVIGVLPYIDPQVLLGNQPNKASDIYSFGIIMWVLATGLKPHCNRAHDWQLAYEICYGNLRPEISEDLKSEMPIEYYNLMIQCWDPLPENRPTANELNEILGNWISDICDNPNPTDISNNFGDAEERRWELIGRQNEEKNFPSNFVHEEAVYTSRIFDFSKLRQSE